MKNLSLFLLMIIVFVSCKKDKTQDIPLTTINLILSDNPVSFKKTVILFESNDYLVKTSFETYISEYIFVKSEYADLKIKAISDASNLDTLKMVDYLRYENDSIYILAHYLETGKCLIFDKKSNSVIKSIQMTDYAVGGPMQTTGGRRFYIKGKLFLETIDFLS